MWCFARFGTLYDLIMDKGGHFSALLTDLSKAFDCLPHDLLIAKLNAYGFKNDALYLFLTTWIIENKE